MNSEDRSNKVYLQDYAKFDEEKYEYLTGFEMNNQQDNIFDEDQLRDLQV